MLMHLSLTIAQIFKLTLSLSFSHVCTHTLPRTHKHTTNQNPIQQRRYWRPFFFINEIKISYFFLKKAKLISK